MDNCERRLGIFRFGEAHQRFKDGDVTCVSERRRLPARLLALSMLATTALYGWAQGAPSFAASNALCTDDGTTAECDDVTADGIDYPDVETVNVEGSVAGTPTVNTGTVGISLTESGVNAPDVPDETEFLTTYVDHDGDGAEANPTDEVLVVADGGGTAILSGGHYILITGPVDDEVYTINATDYTGDELMEYLYSIGTQVGGTVSGSLTINNPGLEPGDGASFNTSDAHGIYVKSQGGKGSNGSCSTILIATWCDDGNTGGAAGSVAVNSDTTINVSDSGSGVLNQFGVSAISLGGAGGNGGGAFGLFASDAGGGGNGGNGSDVTVTLGTNSNITTWSEGAHGVYANSSGGNGGSGGDSAGLVALGDDGGNGGHAGEVTVTNDGVILTYGEKAYGIYARSIGAGAGSGSGAGGLVAVGGNGGGQTDGDQVTVTNTGTIETNDENAIGIFAQSIGGGGGDGGDVGGWFSVGGNAGSGGDGDIVTVTNSGSVTTAMDGSTAIFAQSVGGGGGNGGSAVSVGAFVSVAVGGGGGLGGIGEAVTVNSIGGSITTGGDRSNGIFAQSIGGSGGNGGSSVAVSGGLKFSAAVAVGGDAGAGGIGGDVFVDSSSRITTGAIDLGGTRTGHDSIGIFAQSVGGSGGNGGLAVAVAISDGAGVSVGVGGSGGSGADAGGVVTMNNSGGSVTTFGDRSGGILAQSVGGGGGNGGFSVSAALGGSAAAALSFGGSGAAGGAGGVVDLFSAADVTTAGDDSSGVVAQSVGGGGGNGGFSVGGSISGGPGAALSFAGAGGAGSSANSVDLVNTGSIETGGERSIGLFAQSVGGGGGSGGFSVAGGITASAAVNLSFGGSGGDGGNGSIVTLDNAGSVLTSGEDSHGILAQSVGGGGGSGGFSVKGAISGNADIGASFGGSGGAGSQGKAVTLTNTGSLVITDGSRSYGVAAQSVGGAGGDGGFSVAGGISNSASINLSMGGNGGGDGVAGNVILTNAAAIGTVQDSSHGIVAQSIGGGGGSGGFSIQGSITASADIGASIGGSGGGSGSSGTIVVTNTGTDIETLGARSHGILAQSIGGSGGDGGFSVVGGVSSGTSVKFGMGGSGGDGAIADDVTVTSGADIGTSGEASIGILAQSIGGGGGSGGLSVRGAINKGPQVGASIGGSGGDNGQAGDILVNNTGDLLTTSGTKAHGIFAQSVAGTGGNGGLSVSAGINNEASISASVGGFGGGTQDAIGGKVTLNNSADVGTSGDDAHGLYAQSLGGSGGDGGMSISGVITKGNAISASVGGFGGDGGTGGDVVVSNTGLLLSTSGERAFGIKAQSVGGSGGGGGFVVGDAINQGNSFTFEVGGGGGTSAQAGTVDIDNTASILTLGADSHGIFGQSVGAGGTGGFSIGGGIGAGNADIGVNIGGTGGLGAIGDEVTVINTGATLVTQGDRAFGVLAQSVGGVGGDGGSVWAAGLPDDANSVKFAMGGTGGVGGVSKLVTITNSADLLTQGADAHGLAAQSLGGGGGTGGFAIAAGISTSGAAVSAAIGGNGGGGAVAAEAKIISTGSIVETQGERSYGLFVQSAGGGGGDGGFSVAGSISQSTSINFAMGGGGGTGGKGGLATIENSADLLTGGNGAHGILAQSLGGGGGSGGFSVAGGISSNSSTINVGIGGAGGDSSTSDEVNVNNTGDMVATTGDNAHGILAQSVAGSGGAGGFTVAGGISDSSDISFGIGGTGGDGALAGDVVVITSSDFVTTGGSSHGVMAQSVGGGGGSGGFSVAGAISKTGISVAAGIGGQGGDGSLGGTVTLETTGGEILTLGDRSYGVLAQSIGGSGGDGNFTVAGGLSDGAAIAATVGGLGGNGGSGGIVRVDNQSVIQTQGSMGHGIVAQSIGGGGGSGGFAFGGSLSGSSAGISVGVGGTSGDGATADLVDVDNAAAIATLNNGSHAILAQSIGGGGGIAGFAGSGANSLGSASSLSASIGGQGGTGNDGGVVDVLNSDTLLTLGDRSHGIFAQSIGGGGGEGGTGSAGPLQTPWASVSVYVGGAGGASGDGTSVDVAQTGQVETQGTGSAGIFAQSIGGGGGIGGTSILGLTGTVGIGGKGGASGDGGDVIIAMDGSILTSGTSGYGIFAQSIGGGGGVAGNVDFGLPNGEVGPFSVPEIGNIGLGVSYAGAGGNAGNGGLVDIDNVGTILTLGDSAHAIFAQSVGGGGGLAGNTGTGLLGEALDLAGCIAEDCDFLVGSVGGDGSGGDVSVQQSAGEIFTTGDSAHGIFAQSAGGATGGGLADNGGAVSVALVADGNENQIATAGVGSSAIFAQSLGTDSAGDIDITIGQDWIVVGGTGHGSGVQMRDGASNLLTNDGSILTYGQISGLAVYGTSGDDTVNNNYYMMGMMALGTGTNALNNAVNAWFDMGSLVDLGGGLLTNSGVLAPGTDGEILTTVLDGDFTQTASGFLHIDWDYFGSVADQVALTGAADLDGELDLTVIYRGFAVPGVDEVTVVTADGGVTATGLELVVFDPAVAEYEMLFPDPNDVVIRRLVDFAPDPLNANQTATGNAINDIQTAGSFSGFEDIIQAVYSIGDYDVLASTYDILGPEVYSNVETIAMLTAYEFSDRLMSCKSRDGDNRFIRQKECNWIRFDIAKTTRDQTVQSTAMENMSYKASGGTQKRLNADTHFGYGFSVTANATEINKALRANSEQVEGGFAVKHQDGDFLLSGTGTAGFILSSVERKLPFLSDTAVANSEQVSGYLGGHLRASYLFGEDGLYFVPSVDFGATFVKTPEVEETGTTVANLTIHEHSEMYYGLQPSFEFGAEFENNKGTIFRPFVKAGITHFFGDTSSNVVAHFSGAPAGTGIFEEEVSIDESQLDVVVAVDILTVKDAVFRIGYDGRFSEDMEQHGGFLKLSIPW